MNKGILIIVLLIITGCVTDKSYIPVNSTKKEIYIERNGITFHFSISGGNNKALIIALWFDSNVKIQKIKNIAFEISPNDRISLTLAKVHMSNPTKEVGFYRDTIFEKSSFKELPDEFRMTSIEGERKKIRYFFDYQSNKKIKARFLKIDYNIELEDGSVISGTLDLKLDKSHRFAIH